MVHSEFWYKKNLSLVIKFCLLQCSLHTATKAGFRRSGDITPQLYHCKGFFSARGTRPPFFGLAHRHPLAGTTALWFVLPSPWPMWSVPHKLWGSCVFLLLFPLPGLLVLSTVTQGHPLSPCCPSSGRLSHSLCGAAIGRGTQWLTTSLWLAGHSQVLCCCLLSEFENTFHFVSSVPSMGPVKYEESIKDGCIRE